MVGGGVSEIQVNNENVHQCMCEMTRINDSLSVLLEGEKSTEVVEEG
jgi:hypothetical protein